MPIQDENKDGRKYRFPKGWLIKAFRNLRVPHKDHQDVTNYFQKLYEKEQKRQQDEQDLSAVPFFTGSREVAYGNYDRIQITPVEHLFDFTREANQAHDWLGSNQSILLYKWKDDEAGRCFRSTVKEGTKKTKICVLDEKGNPREKDFLAVTFCYISDDMRSRREDSYKGLLNRCESQIRNLVDAFNKRIRENPADLVHTSVSAEVFGSLGAAEIVILWSAKQYTDVMYLIDCIRDFECRWGEETLKLFRTTYTLITFPDAVRRDDTIRSWEDMQRESQKWDLKNVLGDAYVMFATQDGAGEKTFEDFKVFFGDCLRNAGELLGEVEFPKYELIPCAGEYDLLVKVPSKYVTRLFHNPKIWHEKNDRAWLQAPTLHDAACSVFHPTFNQYILYSFTRLSYQKNRDLPIFARGEDKAWNETRKQLECVIDVHLKDADLQMHTKLIKAIDEDKKELDKLLGEVQARIPLNSNLSTELNQLFNDYAQCMCASADGLWIEDYRELYWQILHQLLLLVKQLDARKWDSNQEAVGSWGGSADWDPGAVIEDINRLIRSLHYQSSHISTSSKQLFREQETHFGYTAQHDLVLHAYYDIVKHLMKVIYDYSDRSFQSTLYPLVNFCAGDHIISRSYFEESAEFFLKTGCNLHSRVIVIEVPVDGMDNLMYYIPMMVHEVFHYAAPKDRSGRNRMLAKFSVYLALEHSLTNIFNTLFQENLKKAELRKPVSEDRRTAAQLREPLRKAEVQFRKSIKHILRRFVDENLDKMFQSLEDLFFVAEAKGLNSYETTRQVLDLKKLRKGPILRSWFLVWLENWLWGYEADEEDGETSPHGKLSDFFKPLFLMLEENLPAQAKMDPQTAPELLRPDCDEYNKAIDRIKEQLVTVLYTEDGVSENNDTITQQMMIGVRDYIDSGRFQDLMTQLDELFPDIAMVTLTKMPPSGYMLQVALDLDKKRYSCNSIIMNDLRFATVLCWLVNRQSAESGVDASKCLERELKSFQKLYRASYEIIAFTSGHKDNNLTERGERWSTAFRHTYYSYYTTLPECGIMDWIHALLLEQMLPCLQVEDETKHNIEHLFQKPYNVYLKLLQENKVTEEMLGTLFRMSIHTILQFQHYRPLRQLNNPFEKKVGVSKTFYEIKPIRPHGKSLFDSTLMSDVSLLAVIRKALNKLYRYREEAGLHTPIGMWYRGVSNAEYSLLPSGFVHFAEDAGLLNGGLDGRSAYTYLDAQRHNYECFRYTAEGSNPDTSTAQYQCTINYMTLMQHYGQHTNLMDWSEDFFAATYFALEPEIKLNDDYPYVREMKNNIRRDDADNNAALYILDPVRFNLACQSIEKDYGLFNSSDTVSIPSVTDILNLSIPENQNRMREYHELYPKSSSKKKAQTILTLANPDRKTNEQYITLTDIRNYLKLKPTEKLKMHLPRAVYAAKLNARIRAQSGLFIAYSLLSPPVTWEGASISTDRINSSLFHYQGLEQIQDYYLSMNPDHHPFMMKIQIPSNMKLKYGWMFYQFGLSTERIYPELQNYRSR